MSTIAQAMDNFTAVGGRAAVATDAHRTTAAELRRAAETVDLALALHLDANDEGEHALAVSASGYSMLLRRAAASLDGGAAW